MIVRRCLGTFAATLLALMLSVTAVSAQTTTATVSGTVKDGQGGVIPGASVTLISESRATRLAPAVTNETGDFVIPNITADTYSIEVAMSGFKTLKRPGIVVGAATRVAVGILTIEVGGMAETVEVKGESPVIQSQSGERSFTVTTESVESLPIASRSFTALAQLAPGVNGTSRIGDRSSSGGGNTNFMMDGVSTMDTGSNSVLLQMTVESIAEVKVLVSNYQAEYGRSSGLQVTAVTKSGTNRFRGSLYDVERNSDWNSNTKQNILNGDPKAISKQRDWGYSIGGPIGKPGGSNRLFFFYSQEFMPRQAGNDVQRFRVPTAAERAGDFSQSYDNNGNPYSFIRDASLNATCASGATTGCFADGGVTGKIPANRLYQPGLNILNMFPMPTIQNAAGLAYNYESTRPAESALAWQPAVRVDYNASQSLRATFKYSGWAQRNQVFNGSIPGFNDTKQQNPKVTAIAATVNYSLTPTMFIEGTYGHSQNELAGCALAQNNTGPVFCQNALPMNPIGNRITAGLGNIPMLFPDALALNSSYYAYDVLQKIQPPMWQDGLLLKTPNFTWGGRVANGPPNIPFPGYFNINATDDISISLTKLVGRHTLKAGFYNTHSYKAQQQGNPFGALTFTNDTANPSDSQFPFANAALGIFSQYQQQSKYIEGTYVYNNTEGFIQDNWKFNEKLTFDYGMRFVHQQPQYDELLQTSNFFMDRWSIGQAPAQYVAGCSNGAVTCTGTTRQAKNPLTGQLLGPNSTVAIGTLVPNTGDRLNGLVQAGKGIADTNYTWPALVYAPRFGMAYDVTGKQELVLRGGVGLFYDRPSGNSIYAQVQNPPSTRNVTVRYGTLQDLANAQFATEGAPSLAVFEYESKVPSSAQWNFGVQMMLPFATSLDVEYVGNHSYNIIEQVNLNNIDFGAAFAAGNQDATLGAPTVPGGSAVTTDLLRPIKAYGNINMQMSRGWITYHSLQLSFQRRFQNGLSFGFIDTIGLSSTGSVGARLQHAADGTYSMRDDYAQAEELLQQDPVRHTMRANFTWDLPDLKSTSGFGRAVGLIVNDWQLSGIWAGITGSPYTVGFGYQSGGGSVNLTGSPDYGARVRIVGDPGKGCSSNQYSQFNTSAFQGPLYNSVGLESGQNYLKSCFSSVLDLAVARNIRLGGGRNIQLRVDMFNAPNQGIISARNTTMNLTSPADPVTITNPNNDASGNPLPNRIRPNQAGFGAATNFQAPRTIQLQVRFSF